MEDKLARQKELTGRLREAARAYYQENRELMSNARPTFFDITLISIARY